MNIPDRVVKHQNKVETLMVVVQLPTLFISPLLFQPLSFSIAMITTIIIFSYFNLGFWVWKRNCLPESVIPRKLYFVSVFPYFIWVCFCLLNFIPSLFFSLWLITHAILHEELLTSGLITALRSTTLILFLIAFYACAFATKWVRSTNLRLAFAKLPKDFNQYRIIHMSDFHIGNFTPVQLMRGWRKKIYKLKPDIILVTGDLLTFGNAFMEDMILELKEIAKIAPVVMCSGNHEYFVDYELLKKYFENSAITLLENNHIKIPKGDGHIYIAGIVGIVDKLALQIDLINQAIADIPANGFRVLLSHEGTVFDYTAHQGIDLVLSGHTHGGQIALPFIPKLNLAAFRYPFNSGLYSRNNTYLYVSRGLGCMNLPMRLWCSPEIVVIDLVTQN